MNRILLFFAVLALCGCSTQKQEVATFKQSQEKQNVTMAFDVNKNANFSFTVSTADPVMLRTFMMQGFDLIFKGKYEYIVKAPSAKDVEDAVSHHPGEVKATVQGEQEKRPDVRPVLEALNKTDVFIYLNGKKAGKVKKFDVSIDPESGVLTYAITLPNIYSMDLPMSVNLVSHQVEQTDENRLNQQANRNTSERPQPFGVGQPSRADDAQKELSISYYFDKPSQTSTRTSWPSEIRF